MPLINQPPLEPAENRLIVKKIYNVGDKLCDAAMNIDLAKCKTRSAERKSVSFQIDDEDVSYTYGEITKGSVNKMINLLTDPKELLKLSKIRDPAFVQGFILD